MDRIDELAAFVAVAEEGSFVGAARRLGRSPAALTRAVAALEERLGARLFTRTTRAVVLTDAGRRHLAPCGRILDEMAALEETAARERAEPAGRVTVTASIVFGRLHVLPVVADFLRRHLAVSVRMVLTDEVVSLVEHGIDLAVRIAHLPDSTLKATRVGSVRRAIYASPAYLAAHGEPRSLADLAHHTWLSFAPPDQPAERWEVGRGRRKAAVPVSPRLTVNLAEPAIEAAVAGLGLTRVLSYMVDHLVAANLLRPVLRGDEPPPIPIHLVHPAGRHLPAATRLLLDDLARALRGKFAD